MIFYLIAPKRRFLISYKENFMAVVIESEEIANMQRFIFNLAWENFKK